VKRKTYKEWDPPINAGYPIGLYMHPTGANRRERRASRVNKDDELPPSSMVPAVKRFDEKGRRTYVAAW
jgi:hypothetical protein